MEDSSNPIVEERVELMVSRYNKSHELRTAHFITPSILDSSSIDGTPIPNLSSLPSTFDPRTWPIEANFYGWRKPQKEWKLWVVKMASLHESTWKKAGIFEAIMNSTYHIERNNDMVFGVAKKWCHETKSFVFPWGEATVTLEDIMVIGGYSVLGSPVFAPVESEEMGESRKKLENSRRELNKSSHKKASQSVWLKKFMNSGSEIEHEAFLALWLSRFVFPSAFQVVVNTVFSIAVHLARGTRIALGPAVLAKIYIDLSCLKRKVVASTRLDADCDDGIVAVALWSPLQLVQVWVWERFPGLCPSPRPNSIDNSEPRLALWHHLKCKVQDVRSVLDSAKESFVWRPYVNDVEFYGDTAKWISVDSSLDYELLSLARSLRVSELVGLDCIEQYFPHRAAFQFGMDQDIPGHVPRSNNSAWANYNTPIAGGKLYIPSRVCEGEVTSRYLNWWKQSTMTLQEGSKDVLRKQRSFTMTPKRTSISSESYASINFKTILKSLKRSGEDDTCSGFKTPPKDLNQSRLLKRKEKGNKASSDLGSALKRLKQSTQCPKQQKEACNASYVARSSSMPTGPAFGSEVNNESQNETISSRSFSKALKESQPDFVIQRELNNSPFPPGFPPKYSLNGDKVTAAAAVHPNFTPKSSINEDKASSTGPPGFPPKCNRVEVKGIVDVKDFDEDEGTATIDSSAMNYGSVGNKVDGNHSASHRGSLSLDSDEDQLTISEMLNCNRKINDIGCRGALDNSSGQCSVADDELPRCELITTLGATNAANEAAIGINDDCPNETPWLRLEERISRLERLATKTKAMLFGNI
ncbi:C globular stage-like protein [Hibiscus syriacus]|uniref:C globular stage-like protein n=1 Tax=Hibiscus syriacus TaxID=106335 RepID=A0A6A2Y6U5_HIBSY|nr:uncharacterized protein LOC120160641 [Hibiscus syriacus]KAE8680210.1 C globular stage-like protein [Hibiscus syriacus]